MSHMDTGVRPTLWSSLLGWVVAYLAGGVAGLTVDVALGNWVLLATFLGAALGVLVRAVMLAVGRPGWRSAYVGAAITVVLASGIAFGIGLSRAGETTPDIIVQVFLGGPIVGLAVELLVVAWVSRQRRQRGIRAARREWEARRASRA
jgi:hypothetical protein